MEEGDLFWKFQEFSDRMEANEKHGKAFLSQLENGLFTLVTDQRKIVNQYLNEVEDRLRKISEEATREVFDIFDLAVTRSFNQIKCENTSKIPKLHTRKEAEFILQNRIKEMRIPKEDHQVFSDIYWDIFQKSQQRELFIHSIYTKIKEVLIAYYEGYIQLFESQYLRMLDSEIHFCASMRFAEPVFVLEKELKKKKKQ